MYILFLKYLVSLPSVFGEALVPGFLLAVADL